MFEVKPPFFESNLPDINATRWSNFYVALPKIIDSNGLNWSITLNEEAPKWVILENINTLLLLTNDFLFNISENTAITLIISNEKNAWREYNLNIFVEPYYSPLFDLIRDIITYYNETKEVKLNDLSEFDLQIVDCSSSSTIPWITYIKENSTLILKPLIKDLSYQWAKLVMINSCHKQVASNEFTITILHNLAPPSIGNTFGPLELYSGQSKLFIIHKDLFISSQLPLIYSVSVISWSINTKLYADITTHENENDTHYLYLQSNDAKTCFISISATNKNNSSAEIIIKVNILNWASKTWIEWTSQLQSGWK